MSALIRGVTHLVTLAYNYALPLSLAGVVVAVAVCTQERDSRIRAEGAEQVYAERFTASVQRADSLDKIRAEADSQALAAAVRISRLRREADSLQAEAERAANAASIRATRAGDSLRATLDSLARVVPPELRPLTATAQRQHREETEAYRDVRGALESQLANTVKLREAADSTTRIWQTRYRALERSCEACREALEDAEGVVGVRGQGEGPGLFSRTVTVLGSMATGAVLWAAFGP